MRFSGVIFDAHTKPSDWRTSQRARGDRRTPNAPAPTMVARESDWLTLWHTMIRARGAAARTARSTLGQDVLNAPAQPAWTRTATTVRDRPISLSPERSELWATDQRKSLPIEVRSRCSFEKSPSSTTQPLWVMVETMGTLISKVTDFDCTPERRQLLDAQKVREKTCQRASVEKMGTLQILRTGLADCSRELVEANLLSLNQNLCKFGNWHCTCSGPHR